MIFTFYSFKGGVGRSMALANVAEVLCDCGLRVLIIDFDLEAPGLERFFNVREAKNTPDEICKNRGLIDLLISCRELHARNRPFESLNKFITPIYDSDTHKGSLAILPAGCRDDNAFKSYAENILSFNWDEFYSREDEGEVFFEWFRNEVEAYADVVLIDSRTGINEIGGICTHHLADAVVMLVGANEQHLDGVRKIATSLSRLQLIEEGRNGRPLSLLFVPSRLEDGERDLYNQFAKAFTKVFSGFIEKSNLIFEQGAFIDTAIPYLPFYAYQENLAVRDVDNPDKKASAIKLAEPYERLTYSLMQLVPETVDFYQKTWMVKTKLLGDNHPSRAVCLSNRANIYFSEGNYAVAREYYDEALKIAEVVLGNNHELTQSISNDFRKVEQYLNASDLQEEITNSPNISKFDNLEILENGASQEELSSKFTQLKAFLEAQQWQEADQETIRLIIQETGRQQYNLLRAIDIEQFDCLTLLRIDNLWLKFSQHRFGFSIQKQVWKEAGGSPGTYESTISLSFGNRVGWYSKDDWLEYTSFNFNLDAPKGHFPSLRFLGTETGETDWFSSWVRVFRGFLTRAEICLVE